MTEELTKNPEKRAKMIDGRLFSNNMSIFNKGPQKSKRLTERIQLVVTPKMMASVDNLVDKGYFLNRSEFVRHAITRYLDDEKEWIREGG